MFDTLKNKDDKNKKKNNGNAKKSTRKVKKTKKPVEEETEEDWKELFNKLRGKYIGMKRKGEGKE